MTSTGSHHCSRTTGARDGARVGKAAAGAAAREAGEPPRVLCDAMLGRLARKLRLLGIDAAYHRGDDHSFVERACAERRIPITRDRQLLARRAFKQCGLVPLDPGSDDYHEQLAFVLSALGLGRRPGAEAGVLPVFSARCSECNVRLLATNRASIAARVPAFVLLTAPRFAICPSCFRVYWHGTHVDHFTRDLAPAVGAAGKAPYRTI